MSPECDNAANAHHTKRYDDQRGGTERDCESLESTIGYVSCTEWHRKITAMVSTHVRAHISAGDKGNSRRLETGLQQREMERTYGAQQEGKNKKTRVNGSNESDDDK